MAVQLVHNVLRVPPLAMGEVDKVREDAVVPLRQGRGVKHVRLFGRCIRLAI